MVEVCDMFVLVVEKLFGLILELVCKIWEYGGIDFI